jgi:hypothetical protein
LVGEFANPGDLRFDDLLAVLRGGLVRVGVLREPAERVARDSVEPGHVDEIGSDVEELAELISAGVVAGECAAHKLRIAADDDGDGDELHELVRDQPQVALSPVLSGDDDDRPEAGVDADAELE